MFAGTSTADTENVDAELLDGKTWQRASYVQGIEKVFVDVRYGLAHATYKVVMGF